MQDAAARQVGYGFVGWSAEDLERAVDAALSRGELYVALRDGGVAGAFILQWDDPSFWGRRPPDAGYVHKLAVPRGAAGTGVGPALLAEAERLVRDAGRTFMRLDCDATNPYLNAYYQRAGFTLRGTLPLPNGFLANLHEKRV
jgi:protein-tyrosine phosphatase